jgi:hypothetical protein
VRLWALGQLQTSTSEQEESAPKNHAIHQALAQWGLAVDDSAIRPAEVHPVYLWPENVEVWNLWHAIQTQWRDGMAGRTGLDYTSVESVIRHRTSWRPRKRKQAFALIQACERAALDAWAEKRS